MNYFLVFNGHAFVFTEVLRIDLDKLSILKHIPELLFAPQINVLDVGITKEVHGPDISLCRGFLGQFTSASGWSPEGFQG